jgi:hypothetical protein
MINTCETILFRAGLPWRWFMAVLGLSGPFFAGRPLSIILLYEAAAAIAFS